LQGGECSRTGTGTFCDGGVGRSEINPWSKKRNSADDDPAKSNETRVLKTEYCSNWIPNICKYPSKYSIIATQTKAGTHQA